MATVEQWLSPEAAQFLGTAIPGTVKTNGTNFPVYGLAFDAASTETAYLRFDALKYGSGNITCTIEWYADTATSGVVRWEVALAAVTANADTTDIETKAFATAHADDDTHLGTTGQRLHSHDIAISNLDSVAANDVCWLKVSRLGGHANDTMTGDAVLIGIRLSYSDT